MTAEKIKETIKSRNTLDPFNKSLLVRLNNLQNLTEIDARYDAKCMTNFYTESTHVKVGRPISTDTTDFINYCIITTLKIIQMSHFSLNNIKTDLRGKVPHLST